LGKVNKFITRTCIHCKREFEYSLLHTGTPNACPDCLEKYYNHFTTGVYYPKLEEDIGKKDLSYKDELQGITHRGKVRV